jgi:hypothetical protein
MLSRIKLVLRKGRHAGTIEKAVMRQRAMLSFDKLVLPDPMSLGLCVDPKEEVFFGAYTNRELVLWRTRKCGVDDVNVADDHRTP